MDFLVGSLGSVEKGLFALPAVIGCSPKTDKLVCGTAKKRVSSYQNPASPLRSGRRERVGRGRRRWSKSSSKRSSAFKHRSSCSSDWPVGSAASLEQKVKVDCGVNVERLPIKYHCLKSLEAESSSTLANCRASCFSSCEVQPPAPSLA